MKKKAKGTSFSFLLFIIYIDYIYKNNNKNQLNSLALQGFETKRVILKAFLVGSYSPPPLTSYAYPNNVQTTGFVTGDSVGYPYWVMAIATQPQLNLVLSCYKRLLK